MTDEGSVRESRRVLRRIQDHLFEAHHNLGVRHESVGLVDVLYHPTSTLPSLNYVTPRRNTAWVSGAMIDTGLTYLKRLNRVPRVHYIEGLFPPLFAKTLRELKLDLEWELPLMVYLKHGFHGQTPPALTEETLPPGVTIERVADRRGVALWWFVWRNVGYDVFTLGVEPLFVGHDLNALQNGQQIDILMCRDSYPIGIARLSIQKQAAHLLALALLKEVRTPELTRLLQIAAVQAALAEDCTLIYAPGEAEGDRKLARTLGFLDFGSIVCYAATASTEHEVEDDRIVGQPVLALR